VRIITTPLAVYWLRIYEHASAHLQPQLELASQSRSSEHEFSITKNGNSTDWIRGRLPQVLMERSIESTQISVVGEPAPLLSERHCPGIPWPCVPVAALGHSQLSKANLKSAHRAGLARECRVPCSYANKSSPSFLDSVLAGVLFVGDRDDSTGIDRLAITATRAFTYTRRPWLIAIRLDNDLYVNGTFAAPCQYDP
jgi:hypothetical protein